MKFVWKESTKQATQMIATWANSDLTSVTEDTSTVSLNVLAAIGFRKSFDFQSKAIDTAKSDVKAFSTYRDALCTVLDNIILVLPARVLSLPYMPHFFKIICEAATDFRKHMDRMLQEKKLQWRMVSKAREVS